MLINAERSTALKLRYIETMNKVIIIKGELIEN
jgi:hypothetical protein